MILIRSPRIVKAQTKRPPWELEDKELEDLEEITPVEPFEPADESDFAPPIPLSDADPMEPAGPDQQQKIKPLIDYTFLPMAPPPDEGRIPIDPKDVAGDEVDIPPTRIEEANENLDVREMIFFSLNNSTPMRISYTTLNGALKTERTVHPDYVYWAGTNRHILVAWDELRGDWRAFAVNNIDKAKLMEQTG